MSRGEKRHRQRCLAFGAKLSDWTWKRMSCELSKREDTMSTWSWFLIFRILFLHACARGVDECYGLSVAGGPLGPICLQVRQLRAGAAKGRRDRTDVDLEYVKQQGRRRFLQLFSR